MIDDIYKYSYNLFHLFFVFLGLSRLKIDNLVTFVPTNKKAQHEPLFKVATCIFPVIIIDTANMQIRMLTQGLGTYSVKRQPEPEFTISKAQLLLFPIFDTL